MSLHFGFLSGVDRQPGIKRKSFFRVDVRAFAPLFFLVGGSLSPVIDGGAFSELTDLPAVTMVQRFDPPVGLPESVQENSEQNDNLVRCRWQADRVLLSSLGQEIPLRASGTGCSEEEGESIGNRSENRGIREKVIALTSEEYPLSVMAGSIALYDPPIAGLIVGIAKKESDWGKHTPKLHGEECFNYWGYRGYGNRGVTEDGYGCFEKPADAVQVIGNRLIELSSVRGGMTDPEQMIMWKCGSSCQGHSPESVRKWISDVRLYYQQFAGVF